MTEKGLSRDACLANNAGIRPLTFDLNPQDIKFTSLVVQAHNPFHAILVMAEMLTDKSTSDTTTQVQKKQTKNPKNS